MFRAIWGELFHTFDFGRNYTQVHFSQLVAGHDSRVRFTQSPGLLYCINYANNQIVPVKSTDGGLTWANLAGNPDPSEQTFGLYADYDNPQRLILVYYSQLYISQNGGNTFHFLQCHQCRQWRGSRRRFLMAMPFI